MNECWLLILLAILICDIEIHLQNELKLLASLKTKILGESQDIHESFERYHLRLRDTFGEDRDFKLFTEVSTHSIRKKQAYKEWSTSQKSCILLLQGETAGHTNFNWLSPAAIDFTNKTRNGTSTVAFHCCQRADTTGFGDNPGAILSSIIFQLLEAQPVILRNQAQYENLAQILNRPRDRLNALDFLLKSTMTVFLALDRVERINGDVEDFLESLFTRIWALKTSCKVKVLLTSNSNSRLSSAVVNSLKGTVGGSEYFKVIELNQEDVDWDFE